MSNKVVVGSIPEKITYIYSAPKEVCVGCSWDIDMFDNNTIKQTVIPAFPIASNDSKAKNSAIQWADSHTKYQKSSEKTQEIEIDNKNITNVQILSLEERASGGRAYKALVNNFYVDLREDVIVDAMLQVGVQPGGFLKGEYVWAKIGSHLKLIRKGSELHNLVLEYTDKNAMKIISKKNLEVGGVYQDKKKNKSIFLGYINTTLYVEKDSPNKYGHNDAYLKATFDFNNKVQSKIMLFYNYSKYAAQNNKHLDDLLNYNIEKLYFYSFKPTHKFIEKIDQIDLPDNFILNLRNAAKQHAGTLINKYITSADRYKGRSLDWNIINHSQFLNMSKYGDPEVELFDGKKYLAFS